VTVVLMRYFSSLSLWKINNL